MKSNKTLFSVSRDPNLPDMDFSNLTPEQEDAVRCISYDFGTNFLTLESIGTLCALHLDEKSLAPLTPAASREFFPRA
eukprot:1910582-Pleurochrysis_carterae.AAC.6